MSSYHSISNNQQNLDVQVTAECVECSFWVVGSAWISVKKKKKQQTRAVK